MEPNPPIPDLRRLVAVQDNWATLGGEMSFLQHHKSLPHQNFHLQSNDPLFTLPRLPLHQFTISDCKPQLQWKSVSVSWAVSMQVLVWDWYCLLKSWWSLWKSQWGISARSFSYWRIFWGLTEQVEGTVPSTIRMFRRDKIQQVHCQCHLPKLLVVVRDRKDAESVPLCEFCVQCLRWWMLQINSA